MNQWVHWQVGGTLIGLLSGVAACGRTAQEGHGIAVADDGSGEGGDRGGVAGALERAASSDPVAGAAGHTTEPPVDLPPIQGVEPGPTCEHPKVERSCAEGLCLIPAGCFTMGAPRDAIYAGAVADTEVEVRLTHFFLIGRTEVTRREWFALGLPEPQVDWRVGGSERPEEPPPDLGVCDAPDCPILWMGFEDALSYVNLRSEHEGFERCYDLSDCEGAPGKNLKCHSIRATEASPYSCSGYRLPTEAEWEYATRAGTRTAYYSGDMLLDRSQVFDCDLDPNLDAIGWYCGNSAAGSSANKPHPVAQKAPNAWGIYDLPGNAGEWTNDLYNPLGYGEGPLTDPVGGLADPSDLTPAVHPVYEEFLDSEGYVMFRIQRGGNYSSHAVRGTSSWRGYAQRRPKYGAGIRIVRTVEPGYTHE